MSALAPCPFCGGAARIESNRDWHRLWADHSEECVLDADDADLMYPAQPGYLIQIAEDWNRRAPLPAEQPSNPVPLTDSEIDEYFERAGVEMQYLDHSRKWTTRGSIDMTRLRNAVKLIVARIVGQQTKEGGNG